MITRQRSTKASSRPQTKFAKVMFLHLSVSHSFHRGGLPQCMLGDTVNKRAVCILLGILCVQIICIHIPMGSVTMHSNLNVLVHVMFPALSHPLSGSAAGFYCPPKQSFLTSENSSKTWNCMMSRKMTVTTANVVRSLTNVDMTMVLYGW